MKKISNSTQRKIGAILSYAHIFVIVISGLIYTPLMIRIVGQNDYGLYNTVNSFISLLLVLNFGFSSSYIKFYSKYKSSNEDEKINAFNSLFFLVFSIIALISLVIGLYFSFNLDLIFDEGLTSEEYSKARIMVIMLTISIALQFLMTVFGSFITSHQKFILSKTLNVTIAAATVVLNITVLLLGFGVLGVVTVTLSLSIFRRIIELIYCYRRLRIKFDFKGIEKGLFKQVFTFSGLIAINLIVDKINSGIDSVLLGRFCGTAAVAVYAVGNQLNNQFTTFSLAISDVFVPHVHNLVNSEEMDSPQQRKLLTEFFTKVGRVQYMLLSLLASGLVFFGRPFITLWAGDGFEKSYTIALILVIPSIVPLIQNVGIEIQRAENRHHYRSFIYAGMAVINLILSIYLCQKYEGIGSAIGTAFACVAANIIIMNIVYHKKINVDMGYFWKNILRQTLGMIIPYTIGFFIMKFVVMDGWFKLIAFIVIYSLIYLVSVYFISTNDYEKELVKSVVKKIGNIANNKIK